MHARILTQVVTPSRRRAYELDPYVQLGREERREPSGLAPRLGALHTREAAERFDAERRVREVLENAERVWAQLTYAPRVRGTVTFATELDEAVRDADLVQESYRKAWQALTEAVDADGKLTHVQPVGYDPRKFEPTSTAPYGVGAFLLAGSEVYRMAGKP